MLWSSVVDARRRRSFMLLEPGLERLTASFFARPSGLRLAKTELMAALGWKVRGTEKRHSSIRFSRFLHERIAREMDVDIFESI